MSIHDRFANFMNQIDKKLGYALYRFGSSAAAPSWMIYNRIENNNKCVYRAYYFLGVIIYAEWITDIHRVSN